MAERTNRDVVPSLGKLRGIDLLLVNSDAVVVIARRLGASELFETIHDAAGRCVIDSRLVIYVNAAVNFEERVIAVGVDIAIRRGFVPYLKRNGSRIEPHIEGVACDYVDIGHPRRAVVDRSGSSSLKDLRNIGQRKSALRRRQAVHDIAT